MILSVRVCVHDFLRNRLLSPISAHKKYVNNTNSNKKIEAILMLWLKGSLLGHTVFISLCWQLSLYIPIVCSLYVLEQVIFLQHCNHCWKFC